MISTKQFGALLGFAFAAAIAAFGLGAAILCLLCALAFSLAAGFLAGTLGMGEVQNRLTAARDGLRGAPGANQPAPMPRPRGVR